MTTIKRKVDLTTGTAEATETGVFDDDFVWLSSDRVIYRRIEVTFPGVGGQPRLTFTIDSDTGVPHITHLEMDAAPDNEIRTSHLHEINPGNWLAAIVPAFTLLAEKTAEGVALSDRFPDAEMDRETRRQIDTARRASRRKINDPFLREVAEVYLANDLRPVEAVQLKFGGNRRTAFRYIALAREAGHLPPKDEN